METPIIIRKYEYSIPPATLAISGTANKHGHMPPTLLPLLRLSCNFEKGSLSLEGDWQYLMQPITNRTTSLQGSQRERIIAAINIFPSSAIELNNSHEDEFVFPLEGTIKDGISTSPCTGILFVRKKKQESGKCIWVLQICLYDLQYVDCEIKCTVPLLATATDLMNN